MKRTQVLLLAFGTACVAAGQSVTYSKIADRDTVYPNGFSSLVYQGMPVLDSGNIAFFAWNGGTQAVYAVIDGVMTTVVDTSMAVPACDIDFSRFDYPSIDGASVTFWGGGSSADSACSNRVFLAESGTILNLIDASVTLPGGIGELTGVVHSRYQNGSLAFYGYNGVTNYHGIYVESGTAFREVIGTGSSLPETGDPFNVTGDNNPIAFDGSRVAFTASQFADGQWRTGLYAEVGSSLAQIVGPGVTPVPGSQCGARFQTVQYPTFAGPGTLLFIGSTLVCGPWQGVYVYRDGEIGMIVDTQCRRPGSNATFLGFYECSGDGDKVAFLSSDQSIYWYRSGTTKRLVGPGDVLGNRVVQEVHIEPRSVSGEQLAIRVDFGFSDSAIYLVTMTGLADCADLTCDATVDLADLAILLSNFGRSASIDVRGDLDGDGAVGLNDLAFLLSKFGETCP